MISLIARMAWETKKQKDQCGEASFSESSILHEVGEDYLKAILLLQEKHSEVRCIDLANYLNRAKPTVTNMVHRLCKEGFIYKIDEKYIRLTDKGLYIAEIMIERHKFFMNWLIDADIDSKEAEHEACRLEHAISTKTFEKLKIELTVKESEIFALLIMNPKRVFTYEMFMDLVWHEDYTYYSRKAVNNHVSNLRKN